MSIGDFIFAINTAFIAPFLLWFVILSVFIFIMDML
jgi:hypothetical protein